ncbi:MAG: hypothetical protein P4L83_17790 [Nevskia sp.]|nr:hypothetical protein [Nevskia sp.]
MPRSWRVIAVWLALAGVLYRGLIPAGFMPASGEAARHGTLLALCSHGALHVHGGDGAHAGYWSLDQCPFGAAAGPGLPAARMAWDGAPPPRATPCPHYAHLRIETAALRLPPARGPPIRS